MEIFLNKSTYLPQFIWKVDKNWNSVKFNSVRTLLRITHIAHRKSYLVIICPNSPEKLTKSEIRYLLFSPILFYLPLFGPKILFWSIFSLIYLYLPLFTYIWLYLGLIILIWTYLPLIALILPYVPYSPYIMYSSKWDCTYLQNFRAIGPLFMEILYFEDLGDTKVLSTNAVWVLI